MILAILLSIAAICRAQSSQKLPAILFCNDVRPILQMGSSTVFPVARQHSQDYANPMVSPQALSTGSTLGFENFLAGGSDIATASRAISQKDYVANDCDAAGVVDNKAVTECQGRLPVGVRVGTDELAVIVNAKSTFFPDDISFDIVKILFEPNMAVATFINSIPGFEDAPADIPSVFVPDAKSGTRDFFEEVTGLNFSGFTGYLDDAALIQALLADSSLVGVGVVPLAFASKAKGIRILNIDGIDPTNASQVDSYVMARPLYKYYDAAPGVDNFAVVDYLCALLGTDGQTLVANQGYVQLSSAEVQADREMLLCDDRFGSEKRVNLKGVMKDALRCRTTKKFVLIGSSTVYPISVELARLYPTLCISIDARSTGSTIGILDLIAGAVPIAAASRSITAKDYEAFDCGALAVVGNPSNRVVTSPCQGVEPRGVIIGYDMLAVIVSPDSPVTNLTKADLESLFVDKVNWTDVDIALPGAPALYIPDANSGTHGFFEQVIGEINDKGYVNDNDIAARVAADPNSIGFLGVAYTSGASNIRAVEIEGISPLEFDKSASYTLSRPLFYYYNEASSAGDVKDLLCWVLGEEGQKIVSEVGYVSLNSAFPDVLQAERTALKC